MCDEHESFETGQLELSRRRFAVLGLATTLAACAPMARAQAGLTERKVTIETPDGTMDAFFVHPAGSASPAVIIWPDIAGLRPAFETMARRLAATGRAVLVANHYYRSAPAPQFASSADFREQGGFAKVEPWRALMTPDAIGSDTKALVAWLDGQDAVDTSRGIGTQGYCMGGPITVHAAAASPRIRAAASFHGGGLVTDAPNSPHRRLAETNAAFLFAIARNDDAEAPEEKDVLRAAAEAADRKAEIEVYAGDHGWTVIDSARYAHEAAERAYERLLALYDAAL